jgi:hydrogenase expression/formation protein HypE
MQEPDRGGAPIKAVLFDFDGTLTRPGALDFPAVKRLLGCPTESPILEYIEGLGDGERRREACRILEDAELEAARRSRPNDGAEELVAFLAGRGIARGIITRNSRASIREAMKNFATVSEGSFGVILSRESPGRPKPHPDGVLSAARALGTAPGGLLVVGDFTFDVEAGSAAGAVTAFLTNGSPLPAMRVRPDYVIAALSEIPRIIEDGLTGVRRSEADR